MFLHITACTSQWYWLIVRQVIDVYPSLKIGVIMARLQIGVITARLQIGVITAWLQIGVITARLQPPMVELESKIIGMGW